MKKIIFSSLFILCSCNLTPSQTPEQIVDQRKLQLESSQDKFRVCLTPLREVTVEFDDCLLKKFAPPRLQANERYLFIAKDDALTCMKAVNGSTLTGIELNCLAEATATIKFIFSTTENDKEKVDHELRIK